VAPPGGANACAVPASTVAKLAKMKGVTAQPVLSEDPPATECSYSLPGVGSLLTFVTTGDQLYTPAYPNDIYAEYASQAQQAAAQATTRAYGPSGGAQLTALRKGVHDDLVPKQVYVPYVDIDLSKCLEPRVVTVEYDGTITLDDDQAEKLKEDVANQLANQQQQDQQLLDQANAKLDAARTAVQQAHDASEDANSHLGHNAGVLGDPNAVVVKVPPTEAQLNQARDALHKLEDAEKNLKDLATQLCNDLKSHSNGR
jgi:hypothetical protein